MYLLKVVYLSKWFIYWVFNSSVFALFYINLKLLIVFHLHIHLKWYLIQKRNIILLLIASIWQYYLILCITIARHSRFISNPPCLISSKLHSFLFSYSSYFLCAIHLPLTFWFIKSLITCNPIATAPSQIYKVALNELVLIENT